MIYLTAFLLASASATFGLFLGLGLGRATRDTADRTIDALRAALAAAHDASLAATAEAEHALELVSAMRASRTAAGKRSWQTRRRKAEPDHDIVTDPALLPEVDDAA